MRNTGYRYRGRVDPADDGITLVRWLARRYGHTSATEWAERIDHGLIFLDGGVAAAGTRVRRGQTVIWQRPGWHEPPAPRAFAVLYRDDDLLAVAKPAGLPTLPGGGFLESTLLHQVRARFPEASPAHRLGRWTSGVVLFGRTARARAALARQWAERSVVKRYRALVDGRPGPDRFDIDVRIGPVPYPPLGTLHAADPGGREARTRVRVLRRRAGASLCDVWIETGRPHQVRIHLAAAGFPLVGDPLYAPGGRPRPDGDALPGDPGYHLHSLELTVSHPTDHRLLTLSCPGTPAALRI